MAASIAGVFWRAARLIRECRGRAFREARGMFPGRYSEIFGLGERLAYSEFAVILLTLSGVSLNLLVCRYTLARPSTHEKK